jgi:hypothetical protein
LGCKRVFSFLSHGITSSVFENCNFVHVCPSDLNVSVWQNRFPYYEQDNRQLNWTWLDMFCCPAGNFGQCEPKWLLLCEKISGLLADGLVIPTTMRLIRCHPLCVRYVAAFTIQWMLPHMVTLAYMLIKYSFHSPEYYKFID